MTEIIQIELKIGHVYTRIGSLPKDSWTTKVFVLDELFYMNIKADGVDFGSNPMWQPTTWYWTEE